jgi:hypothetical protein
MAKSKEEFEEALKLSTAEEGLDEGLLPLPLSNLVSPLYRESL